MTSKMIPHMICAALLLLAPPAFHRGGVLAEASLPAASTGTVSDIVITIAGTADKKDDIAELAKRLIQIEKGKLLDPALLKRSIDDLTRSGIFKSISVDAQEKHGRTVLIFRLRPYPLIRDILISGAFPIYEKDIRSVMTIAPGDRFAEAALPRQKGAISDLLKREGYPSPDVRLRIENIPHEYAVDICVDLDKGDSVVLDRVVIEGNRSISAFRLKRLMKSLPSIYRLKIPKRLNRTVLKNDIRRLSDHYREKGFADCRITHTLEKTSPRHATVHVDIDEGPRYRIRFSGNDTISSKKLAKHAVAFDRPNQRDAALRKIASRVKQIYEDKGFRDTRVQMKDTALTRGQAAVRDVEFAIEEGTRKFVRSLTIKGNASIADAKIEKQLLTRPRTLFHRGYFSARVLDQDMNAIRALYRKQGFLNPEVTHDIDPVSDGGIAITIFIQENVQTRVSDVTIDGLFAVSLETAMDVMSLKKGRPYRDYMLKSDENALSAVVSEAGHPFAVVKGSADISADGKRAAVVYRVEEGPSVELGSRFVFGNFRTKENIILREMPLKPGDPFSLRQMLQGQKNIRDLDIFRSVRYVPLGLEEKEERIHLLVNVEEKKPTYAEFSLGFETQKGLFFQCEAGDRNLFGTNKDLWVGVDASQIGYRLESGFSEPRLFGSKISLNTGFYVEREEEFNQDFGSGIIGANAGLYRKFFSIISASINLRFERRDQFDPGLQNSNGAIGGDDAFKPRILAVVTPAAVIDTRDSFLRPKSGFFSSISLDVSKGINRSLDDFVKYRLDARYYYTPAKRLTLAFIGRYGHIEAYGPYDDVPDDQLFFLGGISDVRGVDENMLYTDANNDPLGGRTSLFGSAELRIDLGRNMELPLFFDIGKLYGTPGEGVGEGFRTAAGTGLRYVTPIGPVGLLYGINLDRQDGEPYGRLHLSIGYTF